MNKKTILVTGFFLLAAAVVANAAQPGVTVDSNYNRKHCSGSHCTFIATWAVDDKNNSFEFLEGIITTDTLALGFDTKNQAGERTANFEPGDSFTVPIDASGEIVGHAGRFYDSPPVYFENNGRLRAVTAGLDQCGFDNVTLVDRLCESIASNGGDVIGTWQDSWQALSSTGSAVSTVTCTSNSAGTLAQCTSTAAASGLVDLELTRVVDNLKWQGVDVLTDSNADSASQKLFTSGLQDPFPGSMKSNVTVNFSTTTPEPTETPPTPECSDGLDNDNDDLIDCDDFGCLADVEDPTSCVPEDNDETDTPGFIPGPFQEQD